MTKFRKIAALALTLSVMCTGCNTEGYTPPNGKEKAVYAEELKNKDYCEFPDGMTYEDICNIIYIDGKQIEMPCTLKELVESADSFTLMGTNENEIEPEDSVLIADLKKDDTSIFIVHHQNGDIGYITTTNCADLKINNTVAIGDNISSLFETMDCSDKYQVKSYANEYDLWYTDGVNATRISASADANGEIMKLSFCADLTVEDIPDKPICTNAALEAEPVEPFFEITDWTMEQLVSDISLDGLVFSLPCSAEIFTEKYEAEEFDYSSITGRIWGATIYKNNSGIAFLYYDNENEEKIVSILSIINDDAVIPEFNIMGITDKSTPDDVVRVLGEPNFDNGYETDYTYYFSPKKELYICFDEETKSKIQYLRIRYIN